MNLISWKSFEALMDQFVQEGGLKLSAAKEIFLSPRNAQPEIRWRFPVAGGHYFGALAYWFHEDGEWKPYLLAEIILGSSPENSPEAFFRWALEQNKAVVHPIKISIVGEGLFGLSLRSRLDLVDPEYWQFLVRSMLGYGKELFKLASEQYQVLSYDDLFSKAS